MAKDDARRGAWVKRIARKVKTAPKQPVTSRRWNATVTSIASGTAQDGGDTVTVQLNNGAVVAAPYLHTYTSPAVGDVVFVDVTNGSPTILGPIVGLPSF